MDWKEMTVQKSRMYDVSDGHFLLFFNHTDRRDEYHITSIEPITNVTEPGNAKSEEPFGKWHHYLQE